MKLMTVSLNTNASTLPGGTVSVQADTWTEAKTLLQTAVQNLLNPVNATQAQLQSVQAALNS